MISIKKALRNQHGYAMVGTIIGSIVSLLLVGVISSGLALLLTMEGRVGHSNDATTDITATDAALRSDIRFASTITAIGDRTLSLTVPGEAGRCRSADWSFQDSGGKTQLVRTVTSYPSYDTTANSVRCAGTPAAPDTTVMAESVDPGARFEYANAGGRALTAISGSLAPAEGGHAPGRGSSLRVGASVSLTASFGHGAAKPRAVSINQGAPSLSSGVGPADMASHAVGEKSLRAS